MTSEALITAERLCAGYGPGRRDVIRDISFSLHQGEKLGIIGPNGCGKTTLLRVLAGILPYRGSLLQTIQDDDSGRQGRAVERRTLKPREAARETGLLAQLTSPGFAFTVGETVRLGRYARNPHESLVAHDKTDAESVSRALDSCGLSGLEDALLSELSGGQLQRVYLARALAQDPSVLLLDEPTNHLDLRYQHDLIALIDRWIAGSPRGVIGVFHDLPLALRFADTLILLDEGNIAEYGVPKDVVNSDRINRVYRMDVSATMRSLLQNW